MCRFVGLCVVFVGLLDYVFGCVFVSVVCVGFSVYLFVRLLCLWSVLVCWFICVFVVCCVSWYFVVLVYLFGCVCVCVVCVVLLVS